MFCSRWPCSIDRLSNKRAALPSSYLSVNVVMMIQHMLKKMVGFPNSFFERIKFVMLQNKFCCLILSLFIRPIFLNITVLKYIGIRWVKRANRRMDIWYRSKLLSSQLCLEYIICTVVSKNYMLNFYFYISMLCFYLHTVLSIIFRQFQISRLKLEEERDSGRIWATAQSCHWSSSQRRKS